MKGSGPQADNATRKFAGSAQDEIVRVCAHSSGIWAGHGKRQFWPGPKRESIANTGESHHALKLVVAVGATSEHVQRQIDLRRRTRRQHH